MLTSDLSIFFDLNGFASTHTIGSTSGIVCVVGDKISGRSELDGSWVTQFDIMIQKTDLATTPTKGGSLTVDSVAWTIDAVKDDGEVYTITLSTKRVGEMINSI